MPLPDLFQWLKGSRKSGVLTIIAHDEERSLRFASGTIETYSSRELRDNLGQVLVTHGILSESDMARAFKEHRQTRESLPQVLMRYVDEDDAKAVLSDAARDSVLDLFLEVGGEFIFTDREDELELDAAPFEHVPLDLDMEEAILEGVRRLDEWASVRAKLSRDTMRLRIVDQLWFETLKKPSRERRVFECVARGMSLGEICLELRASRYSIYRLLHHALGEGVVAVADQGGAVVAHTPSNDRVARLVAQAQTMLDAKQWEEAVALFDLITRINPDDQRARDGQRRASEEQSAELYQLFPPIVVPKLVVSREDLREYKLSNEEAFMATRINGESDVGALVMMSPLTEQATLRALKKLLHIGVITVDPA